MYPGWPPRYGVSPAPPAPAVPPPGPAFQSLRDQHLAQLEQLQRMHQRQLESVLPAGVPPASAPPPRHFFTPPRGPGPYSFPPPPPYGHTVPPPDYQQPLAPPPPPDSEQPPPPPAPEQPPPPPTTEGTQPESKSGSLEEQQQYYYKQHMLSLQQKSKNRVTEASAPAAETPQGVPHTSAGHAPSPSQELPPVDMALPPAQDATPGMNLTEDPEQAQRLKTLQEAAAHWQQHEQHRLGFQYQGIIQKHGTLQQLLQRYQQLLVEPPHLAALSVDVQLQHYEMQQKQILPLLQEWESQFKKWQELLLTYPHKEQLQDHHVQWTSWQAHMKATKSQIKDKVTSLKSLKQQYGGNHYIAVVPQYPSYTPVMPPAVAAAVPPAIPPGVNVPPPFSAPSLYSTVPPPPLPAVPATIYPETAPPLPPVSAPPLPPVTSAPPPPPPVNTEPVEAVPPPLPPDNTGSTEAAAQPPPSIITSAPPPDMTSATPQLPPSSAVGSSAPVHPSVEPDTSGDKVLSYQAQQALKNRASYTPLAKTTPSYLPDKPPLELSAADPSPAPEKHPDPKDGDAKPGLFSSGQPSLNEQEAAPPVPATSHPMTLAGPRFSGPGHGFPPPRFHAPRGGQFDGPRGSVGFRGPPPFNQGSGFSPLPPGSANDGFQAQNQPYSKDQLAESPMDTRDGDKSGFEPGVHAQTPHSTWERGEDNRNVGKWDKVQGEPPGKKWDEQHHVPTNRWDQPEEPMHQAWDRPVVPPERSWDKAGGGRWDARGDHFTGRAGQENVDVLEAPKGSTDTQTDRHGLERGEAPPKDMRNQHENPQFDRLDNQRNQVGNKWDVPDNNWAAPNPQHDRWSGPDRVPQDRWGMAENTPDRFGDTGGPGPDRGHNLEGPPQDRFHAPEVPFHGSNRFRFGASDMPPRGRARFPGPPPRGRFVGPEGFNRNRFDNPEGFTRERFGGPEGGYQNQFGGPDDHARNHFEGPNFPPPRNRFGGPPPPERFRGPDFPPSMDQPGHDATSRDNWGYSEEQDKFDHANKSQDNWAGNRAPFNKNVGRPEWRPEGGMTEDRPPLSMDTAVNQEELHEEERWKRHPPHDAMGGEQWGKVGFAPEDQKSRHGLSHDSRANKEGAPPDTKTDEQNAPKPLSGTFHGRFPQGNQFKVTGAELGKTEDVGPETIDKTSSECLLNNNKTPTNQGPSQGVRPVSPTGKKVADTTISSLPKSDASTFPKPQSDEKAVPGSDKKMDTQGEVTTPAGNAVKLSGLQESSALSSSKVPATSDSRIPALDATKPNVPPVPVTNTTAQTPVTTKPDETQVPSDGSGDLQAPAKNDSSTTFSSQPSATSSPTIRPAAPPPHILAPVMFGAPQSSVRPGPPQVASPFRPGGPLGAGSVRPGGPQGAVPARPGGPLGAVPVRPGGPQGAVPVRPGGPQGAVPVRPGGPQGAVPVRPGGPQGAVPVRPGGPQGAVPVRPGGPLGAVPIRPGGPQGAVPIRPGGPQGAVPIRPGGPRGAPPMRPGVPRASPPIRPGAPRPPPHVRPGAPWTTPPIRQGIPQAPPPMRPGLIRGARPVRPLAPRLPPPVRAGDFQTPFSDEFSDDPTNEDEMYEQPIVPDPRAQGFYQGNEPQIQSDHDPIMERKPFSRMPGPEGHHGHMRQNFPDQDMDSEIHMHHETPRMGDFRDYEEPDEPEYYPDDFPSQGLRRGNFDPRFHHPARGRSRGFVRDRLPPRPGSRDVMDVPNDRGFEPRDPFLEDRLPFREDPDDLPPFDREPFHGERRCFERERFLDPLLDDRRRDLPMEGPRSENWERERFWREREPDREFSRDPYFREDRLPLPIPPMPHDLDARGDPWIRERNLDREREGYFDRSERRYLIDDNVGRDFSRVPEDLDDIPLRERDWLPRRPLSPHRPYSPGSSRPSLPPLPPIDNYLEDRWRLDRDLADRDFHERAELRVREYPDAPSWREDRKRNEFVENPNLGPRDDRWYPSDRVNEEGRNLHPAQPSIASELLGLSAQSSGPDSEPPVHGVLALSQRQHEIILKAAQELKMLREQKEQLDNLKNFFNDSNPSDPLRPGTDPLQMPSDAMVKREDPATSKLPSMGGRGAAEHWDEDSFSGLWDEERQASQSANLPVGSKLPGIQQTVDYAHGRDLTVGKVEQTPYGERVVLLPEPALDRGIPSFPKDYLIDCYDRDLRDRDPYFERQSSKHLDRRGYERERERDRDRSDSHRDRGDHDRDRFDRDRHSREERSSSYRDKESSSRRSGSDKPYDRKSERSSYEAPPPGFGGSRRSYPEERPPILQPVPPPEKKPETKNVDDLLKKPGRDSRPDRIVVIMRGLPGSGKTHVAKLIRDKEVECGGSAPRVLSLDDYFMTEVEKVEKDPETGKKVIRKAMEYEYEPEMEDTYRSGMLKTFKKTLDDGFFPFIILDSIHDRVRHFEQFWSAAKTKGFEVYLAEITADIQTCAKRNAHGRKLKEITKMSDNWEPAPRHMIRLDIRSLLQDAAIEDVEMEDSEPSAEPEQDAKKDALEEEESERGYLPRSKWEMDTSEAKLDKLDGLKTRKRDWESMTGCMEDYLQLPDDYDSRESAPGKKRVRWADLEEKKDADRKRAIGFIVGQTDWEKITDKSGHLAERALNRTKYI